MIKNELRSEQFMERNEKPVKNRHNSGLFGGFVRVLAENEPKLYCASLQKIFLCVQAVDFPLRGCYDGISKSGAAGPKITERRNENA